MANGFYNDNEFRAYPFISRPTLFSRISDASIVDLPLDAIVDFGCVLGVDARWQLTDTIWLQKITRTGGTFRFAFRSSSAEIPEAELRFDVAVSAAEYTAFRASASNLLTDLPATGRCNDPLVWDGYLVVGRLAALAEMLGSGDTLTRVAGNAVVEPTLIQDLTGTYVRSINLANRYRTVALPPIGCEGAGAGTSDTVVISGECISGAITLVAGYNFLVSRSDRNNSLTFEARVGAGAGVVCAEVPLYPGETSPDGGSLLTGGASCNEIVGSINGITASEVGLLSGGGVTITLDPDDPSGVIIDVDLADLTRCIGTGSSLGTEPGSSLG